MLIANHGIWSSGSNVPAIAYNGSTNYLSKTNGLADVPADSSTGIISFWFEQAAASDPVATPFFMSNLGGALSTGLYVEKLNASGGSVAPPYSILLNLSNTLGTLQIASNIGFQLPDGWHHFMAAWNTNFSAGNRISTMYIDDVNVKTTNADSGSSFAVRYDNTDVWSIGAADGSGSQKIYGCLAELYFAPGQFLDLTQVSNRRKFIDALGQPPSNLGLHGQDPTGVNPSIYMHGIASQAGINSGDGGNFIANGSFSDCANTP